MKMSKCTWCKKHGDKYKCELTGTIRSKACIKSDGYYKENVSCKDFKPGFLGFVGNLFRK